jgi:hypothetical protein
VEIDEATMRRVGTCRSTYFIRLRAFLEQVMTPPVFREF